MKLIKILRDRVQIRTDSIEFQDIHVNDLLSVGDGETYLACIVTAISSADKGDPLGEDAFIGLPVPEKVIDCSIIGSVQDGTFQKFISQYPAVEATARKISADELAQMTAAPGKGFEIGKYVACDTSALINGNRFFQRHSCIVGNTGSGKSETVARILEAASKLQGANLIVFDIHGEYGHFSYVDNIKFSSSEDGLDFPIWMFGLRDMAANILMIKEESATVAMSALRKCYRKICEGGNEGKPVYFDYEALTAEMHRLNTEEIPTGEVYKSGDRAGMYKMAKGELNGKLSGIVNTMVEKLHDKRYSFLFSGYGQEYFLGLARRILGGEKPVKNIDLSDVPHDVAIPIIGAITKLIYEVKRTAGSESCPITIVCDEAHVYIPNNFQLSASERRMVEIFENIAKEGRKFGVTLLVASQRPSELNKTIMAQCANFIVMKLNNEADKAMIKGMLPDGNESVVDETTMFSPGEAILIGDAAQMPMKVKIDLASERPRSRTIDFWDIWASTDRSQTDYQEAALEYLES